MTTSTDRATFRQVVAEIAEKAKAKLPQAVNGRLENAAKLVLLHDVTPQGDGSIIVGSASDPGKTYRLTGQACECQDFAYGKAPEGWCQHRIAAGIHKRVGQMLAAHLPAPMDPEMLEASPDHDAEGDPEPHPRPAPLPEAPASVNVRVTISGRECQITLRDTDEARLLARLAKVLEGYPLPERPAGQAPASQGKDWCSKHQVAMKENHKDGRTWYSHQVGGQWCKGK
jgi:hypothetical protein